MNLMIVEDEPRLRQAIAYNILWDKYQIEVVGTASNGIEALQMAARKQPDILVVDIQMPEMDGLTLIQKLYEQRMGKSFMKIIILSGHDNFAYAQLALKFGVSRYLLKPAGEEEIIEAVVEAQQDLQQEWEQWSKQAVLEQKWKENLPHVKHAFFDHWVHGRYQYWEILKKSRDVMVELTASSKLIVAVVDLDPFSDGDTRFASSDRSLLQSTLQCLAEELLSPPICWVCPSSKYDLMIIFLYPEEADDQLAYLQANAAILKLLAQVRQVLKLTASAGICAATGTIADAELLYTQACSALQERIVYGHDIAIPYREEARNEDLGFIGKYHLEKDLEVTLELADEMKAMEVLAQLWEHKCAGLESVDEMQESVLHLSSLLIRFIQRQGWRVKQVAGEDLAYLQNVTLLSSKQQIWDWLTRMVKHIIHYTQQQRKTTSNQLVKDILAILDREMDQELTLHTVADRLYVNSSYLSRLFKQEMGVAFSTYVLERKMEQAKATLQDGGKVYDAARQAGYRDVSYFTKVFRKYWGVNPCEMKV